jgi:hypothetical protein
MDGQLGPTAVTAPRRPAARQTVTAASQQHTDSIFSVKGSSRQTLLYTTYTFCVCAYVTASEV